MGVQYNSIDWVPLLPHLLRLMKEGKTLVDMGKVLGVSTRAVRDAIDRHVSSEARAVWVQKKREAEPQPPVKSAHRGRTEPLPASHPITWGAIWGGNPPPYPG